jgi:rhomboid protease GluP
MIASGQSAARLPEGVDANADIAEIRGALMADDGEGSGPERDDDAWIERIVNIAGDLGFNKMRLRWKLIRWQDRRRRKARVREQMVTHITYAHKTCHECGAVQDKGEAVCTRCGGKLGTRGFQVLERIGLAVPVPLSMSTLLAVAILVAYGRVWVAAGGGLSAPHGALLVHFGGRWPPLMSAEPWRLVTAMFLHAGLLHLGFNIVAIATAGPRIEEVYGRATMLGLFIVTGVLANLATLLVGPLAVGVGASGGVMGLIAAAAGHGHRAGTSHGRAQRDAMLKWCAYTFVFGFAMGADNWAHLFGALTGAAFGLAVKPEAWTRRALFPLRTAIGLVGFVATFGAVMIIVTRTPSPPDETREAPGSAVDQRALENSYIDICTKLYAGDTKGAIATSTRRFTSSGGGEPSIEISEQVIVGMCDAMQQLRDDCKAGSAGADRELCETSMTALDRLPVHPYKRRSAAGGAASGSAR